MIYRNIETLYISGKHDSRLVRYDVIKIDADTFRVKVLDEKQQGIAQPNLLIQVDQFDITRGQYEEDYSIGYFTRVKIDMPPTIEGAINDYLQEHRNKI